ncbi:hypothetical protein Gotur_018201 [Gossypium turneri]
MALQKLHALETANTNSRCTPPLSKIKCNIDGVVFMNNEIVGWVAIVRSDSGHFVCYIIGFKSGILDLFMTKVIAACEAFLCFILGVRRMPFWKLIIVIFGMLMWYSVSLYGLL